MYVCMYMYVTSSVSVWLCGGVHKVNKLDDRSRMQLKDSLFNSYDTEESISWIAPLTFDMYFIMVNIKQEDIKYHFLESLVWLDLGLNPSLPDRWLTL